MIIRPEQSVDHSAIRAVHLASFPTPLEANLVEALRDAGRLSVSLVADSEGGIIGHVAFSPVTTASGTVGSGLAPVAVVATHRRKGVAAALITEGLLLVKNAGFGWAVVLGEPSYYVRFGFRPATEFGLCDEYGGGAAFQAMELQAGAMPINVGLVRYAPEFALVE